MFNVNFKVGKKNKVLYTVKLCNLLNIRINAFVGKNICCLTHYAPEQNFCGVFINIFLSVRYSPENFAFVRTIQTNFLSCGLYHKSAHSFSEFLCDLFLYFKNVKSLFTKRVNRSIQLLTGFTYMEASNFFLYYLVAT